MKKYLLPVGLILISTFIIILFGCGESHLQLGEVNLDSNVASKHCVFKGEIYLDKYVLDKDYRFVLVDDVLTSDKSDVIVESMTSDGVYVYYLLTYRTPIDDGLIIEGAIMRWDGTEMLEIARWDRPLSGSSNRSMKRNGDYIYFFRENDIGSNYVCRVKYDGGEVEALCENNTDNNYTGIYFINDSVYVHYARSLYKTDLEHLSPADLSEDKLICQKVMRIFLQDGRFYYVRYMDDGITTNLYSILPDGSDEKLVLENIIELTLTFTDGNIYFSYFNPEELGQVTNNGKEITIYNVSHGSVYKYETSSGNITEVISDFDIEFYSIYNATDSCILAEAYTNEQYLSESGLITRYMLVPTDGSEAIILEMGS